MKIIVRGRYLKHSQCPEELDLGGVLGVRTHLETTLAVPLNVCYKDFQNFQILGMLNI